MKRMLLVIVFFILLILLFITFETFMHRKISTLADLVKTAVDDPMAVVRGAMAGGLDLATANNDLLDLITVNDPAVRQARLTEVEDRGKYAQLNIDLIENRIVGDEGKKLVKSVIDLTNQEKKLRERIVSLIVLGNISSASHLMHTENIPLNSKIQDLLFKITFHAESTSKQLVMNSLRIQREAKIIVISMGCIIFILTLLFIVVLLIHLDKSLKKTRKAIVNASLKPFDLVTRLKTPSLAFINEAFNGYIINLADQWSKIASLSKALQSELGQSPIENGLSNAISLNIKKIEDLGQKSTQAMDNYQSQKLNQGKIIDILNQIQSDLTLVTQITGRQKLLINQLKLDEEILGPEKAKLVENLRAHNHLLVEQIDRIASSIDTGLQLIKSFISQTTELSTFLRKYTELGIELRALETSSKADEKKLSHIKDISEKLNESLKSFKVGTEQALS